MAILQHAFIKRNVVWVQMSFANVFELQLDGSECRICSDRVVEVAAVTRATGEVLKTLQLSVVIFKCRLFWRENYTSEFILLVNPSAFTDSQQSEDCHINRCWSVMCCVRQEPNSIVGVMK